MNRVLTSLATDRELADASPSGPEREVLASFRDAPERYEARGSEFAGTTLAGLDRRLARLDLGRKNRAGSNSAPGTLR